MPYTAYPDDAESITCETISYKLAIARLERMLEYRQRKALQFKDDPRQNKFSKLDIVSLQLALGFLQQAQEAEKEGR